jgi:GntR family transcriptional regulator/MocR family aminotransferase
MGRKEDCMTRYRVDKTKKEPAYMQLYRAIRSDITEGIYRFGDRLPSRRTLASDTGTSVITADHAYELLAEEGYVEPRMRSGYYVSYVADKSFAAEKARIQPVSLPLIHTGSEVMNTFPFTLFARTMRKVLTKYGERILIKSPNLGVPELREALASYLARSRGIHVRAEQIVIGSGSEYMYSQIVQMLGREKLYGIEDPSYAQIRRVYNALGAKTDLLKMGHDGILSAELLRTKADVLHITPFHSYPSGVTADASKRMEYIKWAKRRRAMIIEDDMDSEFTMSSKAEDTVFSLEPGHTVIYMNTFSRTIAPSMRSGYMVLPADRLDELMDRIGFYSCSVPVVDQYLLAEFLSGGDFERHINRVRRARRRLVDLNQS